jgi:DNA-directed RNA polymerase subunit RPC12/RpoP
MDELAVDELSQYECAACDGLFILPEVEDPVCCPICRTQRFEQTA